MKIRKSKIKRPSDFRIGVNLPHGKVRITMQGSEGESIWVAKDINNGVMYLLNHALMFYPLPSWGMELPLCDEIDLYKYRGDSSADTDITVAPEAYEALKDYIDPDTDSFDTMKFVNHQRSLGLKRKSQEEENNEEE